jgi:hypothetical protein
VDSRAFGSYDLTEAAAEQLGAFAARLLTRAGGAAAAAFDLLFIPSPNKLRVR